ncbi:MAG TPA: hypothetical protein DCW52_04415 [Gammaproteobacteria bacterium]|nr:hypothetical protein [Gammaproteobacteria bacterium]
MDIVSEYVNSLKAIYTQSDTQIRYYGNFNASLLLQQLARKCDTGMFTDVLSHLDAHNECCEVFLPTRDSANAQ